MQYGFGDHPDVEKDMAKIMDTQEYEEYRDREDRIKRQAKRVADVQKKQEINKALLRNLQNSFVN